MTKFYKIGFFVLAFLLVATGGFYLGANRQKLLPQFFPTPTAIPSPTQSPQPTREKGASPALQPTSAQKISKDKLKENLVAAVTSKNYAALEGYMVEKPSVILASTECCGPMTKAEAVEQMKYLNNATPPWNFDDTNPTIQELRSKNASFAPPDSIVGISANEYVVVFILNSENKVSGINMAVSYKLLIP
ncbi:hypothetical protein HYT33_03545 [Candidatus Roizmanbacteria bacterium]|nr:hypothetical protein [Candidatus Roizmanbacteria bacterium]